MFVIPLSSPIKGSLNLVFIPEMNRGVPGHEPSPCPPVLPLPPTFVQPWLGRYEEPSLEKMSRSMRRDMAWPAAGGGLSGRPSGPSGGLKRKVRPFAPAGRPPGRGHLGTSRSPGSVPAPSPPSSPPGTRRGRAVIPPKAWGDPPPATWADTGSGSAAASHAPPFSRMKSWPAEPDRASEWRLHGDSLTRGEGSPPSRAPAPSEASRHWPGQSRDSSRRLPWEPTEVPTNIDDGPPHAPA
mmetsp:Transcript_14640/g.46574  ORF Transcript_14640/g.46574 Transcript_14640/m.46574 type:complete len:240 (-) Transcript_14640:436-1155(-)